MTFVTFVWWTPHKSRNVFSRTHSWVFETDLKVCFFVSETDFAVCCTALRCVAVSCSLLQFVAVCCSVPQCRAVWLTFSFVSETDFEMCCSVLQHIAVFYSVLQCVAMWLTYLFVSETDFEVCCNGYKNFFRFVEKRILWETSSRLQHIYCCVDTIWDGNFL